MYQFMLRFVCVAFEYFYIFSDSGSTVPSMIDSIDEIHDMT